MRIVMEPTKEAKTVGPIPLASTGAGYTRSVPATLFLLGEMITKSYISVMYDNLGTPEEWVIDGEPVRLSGLTNVRTIYGPAEVYLRKSATSTPVGVGLCQS